MAKIAARSLHAAATTKIREMIRRGALVVGQKIVEKKLCEELGISRTPLREALRSLSSEGLIHLVPNKGAFVSQPSPEEIRDLFEVMTTLEGTCARIAAERMEPESLAQLEALHQELEQHAAAGDRESYISANHRYHTFVQERTGNQVLNELINGLRQKILLYRYRQLYVQDRLAKSIQEHRSLLEAFRRGDPQQAEQLMKLHLTNQGEALLGSFSHVGRSGAQSSSCPTSSGKSE
jgi:DNA-binding GntR family transcriptional regulator